MDSDVVEFAQVMAVLVLSSAAFVAIFMRARNSWIRGSQPAPRQMDENRLDRLEAAVDAIAIEVERISESQRFTVGLLAERLPARGDRVELPAPGPNKRMNTPH
jgi:hypothetical protein